MLWNIIQEFFIKHIFGGVWFDNSTHEFTTYFGYFGGYSNAGSSSGYGTDSLYITLFGNPISFGNYLSLIATIISMVAIVLICCALIKKIYNMCAHIIG